MRFGAGKKPIEKCRILLIGRAIVVGEICERQGIGKKLIYL